MVAVVVVGTGGASVVGDSEGNRVAVATCLTYASIEVSTVAVPPVARLGGRKSPRVPSS